MKTITFLLVISASAILMSACATPVGNTPALPGTKWELVTLNGTAPIEGTSVTLFFGEDDRAGGNASCNTYSGSYKVTGNSLTFEQMMSTMMACAPAINEQEQSYLKVLGETKSYETAGGNLTLKDASGNALAVFAPFQPASLVGEWQAIGINNGKQAVVSVMNGTTVTAVFGADGNLSGNGGCNNYNGSYTTDGDNITIGPVATTRMACEQAVMDQETAYLNALAKAATYTLGKDSLEVRDADGALLVNYIAGP